MKLVDEEEVWRGKESTITGENNHAVAEDHHRLNNHAVADEEEVWSGKESTITGENNHEVAEDHHRLLSSMIDWLRRNKHIVSLFFVVLCTTAFISTNWIPFSITTGFSNQKEFRPPKSSQTFPIEISCSLTCPGNYPTTHQIKDASVEACPEYFRWIHEDLEPWKKKGITRDMVERGEDTAYIRLVIINGRVYAKKYKYVYQTRDVFTIWGILQLLRLYPGKLPDLDMMFDCGDIPQIHKSDYKGSKASTAPPLFHYCGDDATFDIAFPDWSFWGWPELNIKPWETLKKDLQEGNNRTNWMEREPYAYWKGNVLNFARRALVTCNVTDKHDWNARVYGLDWPQEIQKGYKDTDLARQCVHRYKIYVEGNAWSVSEKYVLACDSVSLFIKPHYYDFFTRGLLPTIHYWPINENHKCKSIKFAVDWGNNHTQEAQEIGKAGTKFIQEEVRMKYVYDYMFHVLSGYAKLLKYQPTVPEGAVEICSESLACSENGLIKKFMTDSMVSSPANSSPCAMPPPYDSPALRDFLKRKENLTKQVEMWEQH